MTDPKLDYELRDGVHVSRFSPYIASLEPTMPFLNDQKIMPRCCTEIDVGALLRNVEFIQGVAQEYNCNTMAVIKSDGYGHGSIVIARIMHKYRGVNFFGVATLAEALELRAAGLNEIRILVLGPIHESEWTMCSAARIEIVLDSPEMVNLLFAWGARWVERDPNHFKNPDNLLRIHVYLNTGMNRIGLVTFDSATETHGKKNIEAKFEKLSNIFEMSNEEDIAGQTSLDPLSIDPSPKLQSPGAIPPLPTSDVGTGTSVASNVGLQDSSAQGGQTTSSLDYAPVHEVHDTVSLVTRLATKGPEFGFKLEGICTHMCDAASKSPYTLKQLGRFTQVVRVLRSNNIEIPCVHVANSDTLLSRIIDENHWKELIQGSKAYTRIGGALYGLRRYEELTPILALKAQVRYVGLCEEGMTVGYDRTWIAPRDCLVATLSIGFGDGYNRRFSNKGQVGIRGETYSIAGTICMDMLMVDLGPPNGVGANVKVGDYATLYGLGGPSIASASASLETCQSDLTCHLSRRLARRYVNIPDDFDKNIFQTLGAEASRFGHFCV